MTALARAFAGMFRVCTQAMIQYRGEVALWALWGIIYPAVALTMWSAAAADAGPAGQIKGYGAAEFAAYFLLTMIAAHVTAAWDTYEMGYIVRSGGLSPLLLRPLLPMWGSLANNLAYKLTTLTILIPIWLLVVAYTRPNFQTTLPHALAGVVALLLAGALAYVWGYVIALLAFWTTRMDAIGECYFGASLLLGGRSAPLALLPTPLQWLAAGLPFKWIIWFPVELLSGRLPIDQISGGLIWQVGWLVAGVAIFRGCWGRAVKRYSAVGA